MKKKSNTWFIVSMILIGVLVVGGISGLIAFGNDEGNKNNVDSFSCLKSEIMKITPIEESSKAPNLEYGNDDTMIGITISPLPQTQNGKTISSCSQFISQNLDKFQQIQNIDGIKVYNTTISPAPMIFLCGNNDNYLVSEYSNTKQITQDNINSLVYIFNKCEL